MSNLKEDLLALDSTVMIGSRALGINKEKSDTDLCVLKDEVSIELMSELILSPDILPRQLYTDSILMLFSSLYKVGDVDVFMFTEPEKLLILKDTIVALNQLPKWLLKIKWVRVKLFRYIASKKGFLNDHSTRPTPDISSWY